MKTDLPFDVPEETRREIFCYRPQVWDRYAGLSTGISNRPFALDCLEHWQADLDALAIAMKTLLDDCVGSNEDVGLYAIHSALQRMVEDLGVLLSLAVRTWPYDPVVLKHFNGGKGKGQGEDEPEGPKDPSPPERTN